MLTLAEKRQACREHLLRAGFYVNDGIKYGLDFLVYTDSPDRVHSKYGVVVFCGMTYQQLVMHQRLCCSVNKSLIVAVVDGPDSIRLVQCDRFTTAPGDGQTARQPPG
ncbi:hypothetical protein PAPHI01_0967 [Pancytospora philotis]|nr:hypothetical protein PAPHI01_0967 [Pancytospora philotis]